MIRYAMVVALLAGCSALAADKPNRLARESSPYLLQHAHNPVDWFPWGPEAFAKAKADNKLVFLSIGYSACHWCHVMERESFAHADVAKLLNEHFVCIKVDREERPDVDQVYMMAVQVIGVPGGWPLSVFLTPDAKPIVGGTYWPREDKPFDGKTVAGFKSILKTLIDLERDKPKELREQAEQVAKATSQALARQGRAVVGPEPNRQLVDTALDALLAEFDPQHGGFGNPRRDFKGPKFPSPPCLELALSRGKSPEWTAHVERTFDRMALGGLYDQVGGGFHRYSTERTWTVPHFEKMLYDNAQLVTLYARAFAATKKPLYRRVVAETLAFVERELTSPDGAFYSALDADSEHEEGKFYVWSTAEFDAVLPDADERAFAKRAFRFEEPNFEGKAFILLRREDAAGERIDAVRAKLLAVRAKRVRPLLDTKVLTAWNGQMIEGYATAGRVFANAAWTKAAERAADFALTKMRSPDGRLYRTYAAVPGEAPKARQMGYLDDYAYLVRGLLALHDTTGQKRWLDQAKALTDVAVRFFADDDGGFFYTASDGEKLFARAKDVHDGAQPSSNGVMVRNLLVLAAKTGDTQYRDRASAALKTFAPAIDRSPTGLCGMVTALDEFLRIP